MENGDFMKLRKEVLYVPIYIVLIYLFEKLFYFKDRNLHYIVEFLCLFIAGVLIGLDKDLFNNKFKEVKFDKVKFLITFVPLFVFLFVLIGIDFLAFFGFGNIKLPNFIVILQGIIMYKQVGMVLLGYFLSSNVKYECTVQV